MNDVAVGHSSSLADPANPDALPAEISPLGRRLFLVLGAIAVIYAFLAGLATVADPDLGWQMATGRWVAQHHHVFSTDVFSYTASGAPWIYPVGSGLIFYWAYLAGGFALISWIAATACAGTVALLLRRGSAYTAAIAILAVPLIAFRAVPRAEMFTVVLFAAFLSLLWQNYTTSRASLWLLPVLMIAWVNLHLGFVAGLGLIVAFVALEVLELPSSESRRRAAIQRSKRSWPWFAATAVATMVNPWGWKIYDALIHQQHLMALHSRAINEWAPLRWNWMKPLSSFSPCNTSDIIHLLALVLIVGVGAGLAQRRPGAAVLMLLAGYEATRHVRMVALASCVIVVIAGWLLMPLTAWVQQRIRNPRVRVALATAAVALFAALAVVRSADVLTNRHYLTEANLSTFGTGLSPWFPSRAAEFIEREHLPGRVFNTYNEGGYIAWALGDQYRDYIDGRAVPFGTAIPQHGAQMLAAPLDSDLWQQEANRYGINTIIFPLTLDEVSLDRLKSDCHSQNWRPVYLDEVAIVFLRNTPQNQDTLKRFAVDCTTAPLPHDQLPLSARTFNLWVNTARVLNALGRNPEALSAADNAIKVYPGNAHARWYRGTILNAMDRRAEAEQDWQTALALAPNEATGWSALPGFEASVWFALADLYQHQERAADAMQAMQMVTLLSRDPSQLLAARTGLGQIYFEQGKTAAAEKEWVAALAISQDQPVVWSSLAELYQKSGRNADAAHALEETIRLTSDPAIKSRESVKLARLYFISGQPRQALQQLDAAARTAPPELLNASGGRTFSFDIAQGRAAIWASMGDLKQATLFQEQAVQLDPNAADAWAHLGKLYQRQGRSADEQKAEERSKALRAGGGSRSN